MVNRRSVLLAGGGIVIAGSGIAGIAGLALAAGPGNVSANGFRRCLGQAFGVKGTTSGTVDLTLYAVRDIPSLSTRQEQFTLLFGGPAAQLFDAKNYAVEHYASGRQYQMYLDVAGNDESGAPRYRADYSLIR